MCVIICCGMRCTLAHDENPSGKAGDAQSTWMHCRCPKTWAPHSPALVCVISLMGNKDTNYSSTCPLAPLAEGQANLGRQIWEVSEMKQGIHLFRSCGTARTGSEQRGSCFNARQREESEERPQHFIYQTFMCLTLNWIFFRVCISLPRSQGWKDPSEKCQQR